MRSRSAAFIFSFLLLLITVGCSAEPTAGKSARNVCDVKRDDIRFFGSGGDAGRVELCYQSTWRYVCADHWNLDTANVACRQLGYKSAFMADTAQRMAFQGDSGVNVSDHGIMISHCIGSEFSLRDCQWEVSDQCTLQNAIAAACSTASSNTATSTFPITITAKVEKHMKDMQYWFISEQERQKQQQKQLSEGISEEYAANQVNANNSVFDKNSFIPKPFHDIAAIQDAFLFPESVTKTYQKIESIFNNTMTRILHGEENVTDSSSWTTIRWDAIGMDLSSFFMEQQHPLSLHEVAMQIERSSILQTVRDLYLSANRHNAIHWFLDTPYRYYSPTLQDLNEDQTAMKLYQTLQRDGIVLIEDFGANIDTIVQLARAALRGDSLYRKNETSIAGGGSIVTSRIPILELENVLLHNATLRAVINAYQGPSLLHGYKVTHLTKGLKSTDQYNAGMYHHDRVGRRLKLFLFLNDVDCNLGHPTKVAAGSNKLLYYKSEEYPVTRFSEDFVEENYEIIKGCGQRGGGFLFDTHTIHKGTVDGDRERTVVIAEYHHMAKCAYSKEYNLGIPCPGGDIYRTDAPLF